jgi:hypothetical protein
MSSFYTLVRFCKDFVKRYFNSVNSFFKAHNIWRAALLFALVNNFKVHSLLSSNYNCILLSTAQFYFQYSAPTTFHTVIGVDDFSSVLLKILEKNAFFEKKSRNSREKIILNFSK